MKKKMKKSKLNSTLIRQLIKSKGMTVASCGRLMGFKSPQAIHYVLNNQSVEYAAAFADFFEMNERDFIL